MRKKKYIIPQVGVQHIAYSTSLLEGSPNRAVKKEWTDGTTTPTEIKEEDPTKPLPTEISGAKQWSAWDWDD